jgi:signal transduction histidine kinase
VTPPDRAAAPESIAATAAPKRALALELSARYLSPLLDLATPFIAELPALLAAWDVSLADLRDETNWVSLRFCEALTEWLAARLGADRLATETTRAAYSPKALGYLYPLLRAFGSPRAGYVRLPQFVGVLNKVSQVRVLAVTRGQAQIEYRPATPALRERSPLICRLRKEQLAAGPTLWSLPAATIEELECQTRGDERCLYRLHWAERAGLRGMLIGGLGSLGLALAAASWHWHGHWPTALLFGAIGTLAGRIFDDRRQQRELTRFTEEQNRALTDAAQAMERRFVELELAKRDVDQKVETRTAELRLTTQQLAESLSRLEQLSRVKDEFLANVSHELRTPLTLILGPLADLLADSEGPRRQELQLVKRNAVRLNALVDDLLDLARLQAGQLRLSVTTLDLVETLGRTVEQFQPLAQRRGLILTLAPQPQPAGLPSPLPLTPPLIEGDPRRLEFVFANLLSNALKFTPAGGRVDVVVRLAGDALVVSVADTGPGIAAELREQIFDRFTRFEVAQTPGAAGSGIGLALVKELVELHHGSVTVASAPGEGATFTVTLPLQQPDGTQLAHDIPVPLRAFAVDALIDPTTISPLPASPVPASAPRILVVEDHADMRGFIASVLGRHYAVIECASAEEALTAIAERRPDAVVSDVMMAGMNGYDLCKSIKRQSPTTPVLLLTARQHTEWALHGFDAGADDYLGKPFHPEELLARLDVQLRLRTLMNEAVHREKLATLGQLAAGLAHEVRNPVGAILSGLPKLRRELETAPVRPAAREMVDVAIECAERVSRLVGDLLDLGQPDREGPRLWDPHEGIDAAIRVLRHRAPDSVDIRRRFAFAGRILARPAALNQVFVNLLDNAIHAVGDHGIIEVVTEARDGGAVVSFSDSGRGVPDELRARIFDPFFTTRAPGEGTGLGLHITQRIVHEHGGTIDVLASQLRGACFRIWLPDPPPGSATRTPTSSETRA